VTEPLHAVFLSYASQDAEAAHRICDALRSAGIEVFFDQNALRGGDAWDQKIRREIHDCGLFIPVISKHTQARLEGYFRREWKFAIDRTQDIAEQKPFLLPVVIDATDASDAFVPDAFRAVHWTRLPAGETPPAFVERIGRLLAPSPLSVLANVFPGVRHGVRPARPTKLALLAIVGVSVVALGYLILNRFMDFKPAAAVTAPIGDKSIAVLPFADLSAAHDQEYFADGLADELLDTLARIPGLRVIGRTSSFQFKGKSDDLRTIGAKLGAAHIVEGSVRRAGEQVRVTAQLVRAADGSHEWSRTFNGTFDDTLKLQSEIAVALARALEVSVASTAGVSVPVTANPQAHDLYLRGLHAVDGYTADGEREAVNLFQRAIDLDPDFVSAHEMLGFTHVLLAIDGYVQPDQGFARLRADADWLLKRDARSVMGHWLLARYHTLYSWNWKDAEREANAAVSIKSDDWNSLYAAADVAMAKGELERAEQLFKTSLVSDPLNADSHCELSVVLRGEHRLPEAETEVRDCLEITPTYPGALAQLALTLLDEGHLQEALATAPREIDEGLRSTVLAEIYHALGRKAEAQDALRHAIESRARIRPTYIALAFAYMGQPDQALKWLEQAYHDHDPWIVYLKAAPESATLQADPRYATFLKRLALDD
jgi:TolB-like protein/Tfp pilus assembly protein PilF